MQSYSKTLIGSSHIESNKLCQDYSINKNIGVGSIIAISDGHGSSMYVRSHIGSKLACEIAVEKTQEFVYNNYEELKNMGKLLYGPDIESNKQEPIFTELFRSIHILWLKAIKDDFISNSFTENETQYLGNSDFSNAYGCTLIVAVKTNDFTFAYQIGDGRLYTISCTNVWEQSVPWDKQCKDNITTSLCEKDPISDFRYYVNSLPEQPFAIFMCSDGIEDCYFAPHDERFKSRSFIIDNEEILRCYIEDDDFNDACTSFLAEQSRKISHDDMSVAFILDNSANCQENWLELVKIERLVHDIQTEIVGKKKKVDDIDLRLLNIKRNVDNINDIFLVELKELDVKQNCLFELESQNHEYEECIKLYNLYTERIKSLNNEVEKIDAELASSYEKVYIETCKRKLRQHIKENIIKPVRSVTELLQKDIFLYEESIRTNNDNIERLRKEIDAINKKKNEYESQLDAENKKIEVLKLERAEKNTNLEEYVREKQEIIDIQREKYKNIRNTIKESIKRCDEGSSILVKEQDEIFNIVRREGSKDESITFQRDGEEFRIGFFGKEQICITKMDYNDIKARFNNIIQQKEIKSNILLGNCFRLMNPNDGKDAVSVPLVDSMTSELWEKCYNMSNA